MKPTRTPVSWTPSPLREPCFSLRSMQKAPEAFRTSTETLAPPAQANQTIRDPYSRCLACTGSSNRFAQSVQRFCFSGPCNRVLHQVKNSSFPGFSPPTSSCTRFPVPSRSLTLRSQPSVLPPAMPLLPRYCVP